MNTFNPMQSGAARLVAFGNVGLSKCLLSPERTVVEDVVIHGVDGGVQDNATLNVVHDRYGDDYPGVEEIEDAERYSEIAIDFRQVTLNASNDFYSIALNTSATREGIAATLKDRYKLKLRAEDLVDGDFTAGNNIIQFHPDCLLYVGSITVNIALM